MQNDDKKLNKLLAEQQKKLKKLLNDQDVTSQASLFMKKAIVENERRFLNNTIQDKHFQKEKDFFQETFQDYLSITSLSERGKKELAGLLSKLDIAKDTNHLLLNYEEKVKAWIQEIDLVEWKKIIPDAIRDLSYLYAVLQKIKNKQEKI